MSRTLTTLTTRRAWTAFSAAVVLALAMQSTVTTAAPVIGKPAPEFTVADSHGQSQSLNAQRGSFVVLEWTNHDCPFVQKHYNSGNMQALQAAAKDQGIVWWSVISSAAGKQGHVSPAQANELTASRKATPTAVLLDEDGKVGRLYGARTTPHMYIIDPQGTLVYMGGIDDKPSTDVADVPIAASYVKIALAAIKEGKPIAPTSTTPYGCSVKY